MGKAAIEGKIAVGSDRDMEAITVGDVFFYSVPDQHVTAAKARKLFRDLGLDEAFLPAARKAVDVFEEACRKQESRRVNGNKTEVKVDKVLENSDQSVYQVTRLVRNLEDELIDHPKAMRVRFMKKRTDDQIVVDELDPETYESLKALEAGIREHFTAHASQLPGQKIRNTIRNYVEALGATNVRSSGGVYFLQKKHRQTLKNLRAFLFGLYGEEYAEFHLIPLADTASQREMLRKHFVANTMREIDETIQRYAERLKNTGRKVRKDMVAQARADRQRIKELVAEYQDLLQDELGDLELKLPVLDQQIYKLAEAGGE